MANNIFDWDDEEEEKAREDDVWGAYPLAQPPATVAQPLEPPTPPQPEPAPPQQCPTHQPAPQQQDAWAEYQPDAYDQPPPQQPGVWSEYKSESTDETARQGGLAWSAGIVFFSSVGFMLFLGWIADWLFASGPWGLSGGILRGSLLGFG